MSYDANISATKPPARAAVVLEVAVSMQVFLDWQQHHKNAVVCPRFLILFYVSGS